MAALPLGDVIDFAKERARLEKDLKKAEDEIARFDAKLGNEQFRRARAGRRASTSSGKSAPKPRRWRCGYAKRSAGSQFEHGPAVSGTILLPCFGRCGRAASRRCDGSSMFIDAGMIAAAAIVLCATTVAATADLQRTQSHHRNGVGCGGRWYPRRCGHA